jgi:ubiquitin C-terminal hydrolase
MSAKLNYNGLHNFGATCFINAVLQCLRFSLDISNNLFDNTEHKLDVEILDIINEFDDDEDDSIHNDKFKKYELDLEKIKHLNVYFHFKQLIIKIIKNNDVVIPKEFIISCKNHADSLLISGHKDVFSGEQNDPQQFLLYLLDTIEISKKMKTSLPKLKYSSIEECTNSSDKILFKLENDILSHYKTTNGYSWLSKNFHCVYTSVVKCSKCPYYTIKFEPSQELSIEIPQNRTNLTIYDCLDHSLSKTILEDWKCDDEKCRNKLNNVKMNKLMNLPNTLIIFFKRYNYYSSGVKLMDHIDFPFILNMSNYKLINRDSDETYKLYGVVNQNGILNNGHCYSFCRNINSTSDTNWYCFNDGNVFKIDDSKVVTKHAYILFYKKL